MVASPVHVRGFVLSKKVLLVVGSFLHPPGDSPEAVSTHCLPEVLAALSVTLLVEARCLQSLFPVSEFHTVSPGIGTSVLDSLSQSRLLKNSAAITLPESSKRATEIRTDNPQKNFNPRKRLF